MKVLVVDDEKDIVEIVKGRLTKEGHDILVAYDGDVAWQMIQDDQTIELVVCDWMMPGLDGIELVKKVREAEYSDYIYFILLTAKGNRKDLVEGMRAGADDFIKKPYDSDELIWRIKAGERILLLERNLQDRNRKLESAYSKLRKDLEEAARIQEKLLPDRSQLIKDIQYDWMFIPSAILAGDIFNIYEIDEEKIAFYLVDITGHGVPSATRAFMLSEVLTRKKNMLPLNSPVDMLNYLNKRFLSNDDDMKYLTMAYGVIDRKNNKLRISLAGHPFPILLKKNGENVQIGTEGFPIGMFEDAQYECKEFDFSPGDRIFVYSDGITECANNQNELFSDGRLVGELHEGRALALDSVLKRLEKNLLVWRGSESFEDDLSGLLIERQ